MLKEQKIFKNSQIRRVYLVGRLIEVIEKIIDYDVKYVNVEDLKFRVSGALEATIIVDGEEIDYEVFKDYEDIGVHIMLHYRPLEFYSGEDIVLGDGFRSVYDRFKDMFLEATSRILKGYALKTRMSNVEYFIALINDRLIALEGERLGVRLPHFKTYAIAHTHPIGHIMFSHKDIESTIDLFTEGGILSLVATENSATVLRRRGPYTIDDYEALIDLRDYLKKKNVRINEILKVLRRGENLTLEFYTI